MRQLTPSFFQRDVVTVARELIGIELHWEGCSGSIVETEAYTAEGDAASHAATRPSARAFMQDHPAGSAYVYFNYGMYWLFNLLVKGGPRDGMVLIRALEPKTGLDLMRLRRGRGGRDDRHLCSGPGKLVQALGINGSHHGLPMVGKAKTLLGSLKQAPNSLTTLEILADVRVGISKAADFPWRFLAAGNSHVSIPFGKVPQPLKNKKPSPLEPRNDGINEIQSDPV